MNAHFPQSSIHQSSMQFKTAIERPMAQHLRALSALAEDLGSISSTQMVTQPSETPAPGDLTSSSAFFENKAHVVVHRYTHGQNIYTIWVCV